jgi:hypothetical protein
MEASAVGYGFNTGFKYIIGRSRPGSGSGPRKFETFSGELSMTSGETTVAFVMAGVVTSQYPAWPVKISSYFVGDGHRSRSNRVGRTLDERYIPERGAGNHRFQGGRVFQSRKRAKARREE